MTKISLPTDQKLYCQECSSRSNGFSHLSMHFPYQILRHMKNEGRGVIRLNDKTDHGGHVTAASSGTVVMGILAAMTGDMTHCPKCKGDFAIKADGAGAKHEGRPYAYHDDVTECGARLITSLA